MKFFYTVLFLILSISYSFAQRQGYRWYFGYHGGLNFNSGAVSSIKNGQLSTVEGCSDICDKKKGSLLFYTDGTYIWDNTNSIMSNGFGLGGTFTSSQSALIVPKPGSNSIYYVFTVDGQAGFYDTIYTTYKGSKGLNVSIVDMTLKGGLGNVTTLDSTVLTPTTEKLCGTFACNDTDIWVLTHQWNSDAFYAYLITANGITAPVISHSGIVHTDVGSNDSSEAIGYMKISPNGKKLALACNRDLNIVQIFDFDNGTGMVSNPVTDSNYISITGIDGPYGICFSPDNSKLYTTHSGDDLANSYVYQYDLLAGSGSAIIKSRATVFTSTDVLGALQLAPDGRIYVAKVDPVSDKSDSIDIITAPDALGTACNYVKNAMLLGIAGTNQCAAGLPEMVEQFYLPPFTAALSYPGCSGNSTFAFTDSTIYGDTHAYWNFDDVASGTADTSTQQNPTHNFSSAGVYKIKLILSTHCVTDTLVKTDTIKSAPQLTIQPPSTALCSGQSLVLTANGFTDYTWSPSDGLSATTGSSVTANPTATITYSITGSDSSGCSAQAFDTITIIPAPNVPTITQHGDTLISSAHTDNQWYLNDTLIQGDTSKYLIVTKSGEYSVVVTNPANGCSSNSAQVTEGINQLSINNYQLSVYPNPTSNQLTIISKQLTIDKIEITNVLGQVIYKSLTSPNSIGVKQVIDLSGFANGFYFIAVTNKKGEGVFKVLKE